MCMQRIVKNRIHTVTESTVHSYRLSFCPPAAGFKSGNRTRQNIGPIRGNNSGSRPNCWGPSGGKGARLYAPPLLACQSTVAWADLSNSSISNSNYSISNLSGIALPTHQPFPLACFSLKTSEWYSTVVHKLRLVFMSFSWFFARSRSYLSNRKREKFLEFFEKSAKF